MMGEKIAIDSDAKCSNEPYVRPISHFEIESFPRLTNIASNTRIHKTTIKREHQQFSLNHHPDNSMTPYVPYKLRV